MVNPSAFNANEITTSDEDRRILDFFKKGPQLVEVISLIDQVQRNNLNTPLVLPSGNIFSMETQNQSPVPFNTATNATTSHVLPSISHTSTGAGQGTRVANSSTRKRDRVDSPTLSSAGANAAMPTSSQVAQQDAAPGQQLDDRPTSKRLAVIIDSNMPADIRNCRRSLIDAVKKAGPVGMVFEEIKTVRNSDILITCTNEQDHNTCRKMSNWKQDPYTMSPRFNIATDAKSILYIKRVDKRISLDLFREALDRINIGYTVLERVCVGKDRKETFTLRLIVPLEVHKALLLKHGLLVDHMKYVFEPHVRTNLRQCFQCQRFGHLAVDCTADKRCVRCGESHSHKECDKEQEAVKCSNCSGPHAASDRSCPIRLSVINDHRKSVIQGKDQEQVVRPKTSRLPQANNVVVNRSRQDSIQGKMANTFAGKVVGKDKSNRVDAKGNNQMESSECKECMECMGVLVESIEDVMGIEGGRLADAVLRCVGRRNCKYIDAAALARNFLDRGSIRDFSSKSENVHGQGSQIDRPTPTTDEISLSLRNFPEAGAFSANRLQNPGHGRFALSQRSKSRKTSTSSRASSAATSAQSQAESEGASFIHGNMGNWSSLNGADEAPASPSVLDMSESFRTPLRQEIPTPRQNPSIAVAPTPISVETPSRTIPAAKESEVSITRETDATATSLTATSLVASKPIFTSIAECLAVSIGYSSMLRDHDKCRSSTPQRALPQIPQGAGEELQIDPVQISTSKQTAVGHTKEKSLEAAPPGQLARGSEPKERRQKQKGTPLKENGE